MMREIYQRFNLLGGVESLIDDPRSPRHTDHSLIQLLCQRVYQVEAGYEDCNDAEHLKVDPALRLALGKEFENRAGQSALSRFENNILSTGEGLKALENALSRSAVTLLRRRNKRRLIVDVDSTEDPVRRKQEGAATRFATRFAWLLRAGLLPSTVLLHRQWRSFEPKVKTRKRAFCPAKRGARWILSLKAKAAGFKTDTIMLANTHLFDKEQNLRILATGWAVPALPATVSFSRCFSAFVFPADSN